MEILVNTLCEHSFISKKIKHSLEVRGYCVYSSDISSTKKGLVVIF